ncbi:MAG: hypothetical protein RLZZ361_863 [Cyanobacteriota bacterium]|jgi:hypothetical protein
MGLFCVMVISRRQFGQRMIGAGATVLLGSSAPSKAQPPADEGANNPIPTQDQKRNAVLQALKPQVLTDAEKAIVKEWQNSENGVLRSIYYYHMDSLVSTFNKTNPSIDTPLTLKGVNSAFSSGRDVSVEKFIKIHHDLTDLDQSRPYYAFLTNPITRTPNGTPRQLFRILPIDPAKVAKSIAEIKDEVSLSDEDKELALRLLEPMKPGYWDLRSPYSGAKLSTDKSGDLETLEFNLGKVNEPNLSQLRKIIFTGSDSPKFPEGAVNGIVEGPGNSFTAYLKSGEYRVITK